ncbi:hypothetical protein TDIS_2111 [Thermosulfurimonas dismutans]|uniref:Uncharacterized protein n=1 Tax=Thermosulfurimonas dismutans TaxID=999894 RepID=A0A179D157_9BACT|nr:hypothetical protein TDIS_2111 [Thermosulfurimonas dismutans]
MPEFADRYFPHDELWSKLSSLGEILDYRKGTVTGMVNGVKVSYFSYRYPLLQPLLTLEELPGVKMASDEDIAVAKFIAVAQRGEKKDFYNLWFLMRKRGWDLKYLFCLCTRKYNLKEENIAFLLKSFTFFEDAEGQEIELPEGGVLDKETWEDIKEFFRKEVKRLTLEDHPEVCG